MSVTEVSASGQHLDLDLQDSNGKDRLQIGTYAGVSEVEMQLSFLADVAVAPSCGKYGCCSCPDLSQVEKSIWLQLQFFLSKADCILDCLIQGQKCVSRDTVVTAVQNFLYTCQPFFNHLEHLTRSTVSQNNPLPAESCTREIKKGANAFHTTVVDVDWKQQLLDFSQQLCDKLEQMLLRCSSYNLLSLDEKEPQSVSQFCIGQSQLGHLRLTAFRYCVPTPYLSQVNTGLYKRMRWNVEKLNKDEEREEETDYYFLCYEDDFTAHKEADDIHGHDDLKGIWSIGRWVQVDPDPSSDDINDWILCEVPLANYHRLLFLGEDEPSSCKATDSLMKLLLTLETD